MMMREYRPEDREAVEEIHRRQCLKLTGKPPTTDAVQENDKNQCVKVVVTDDDGRIVGAITGTLRLEIGAVVDSADFEGPASCMGWIIRSFAKFAGIVHGLGINTIYARVEDGRFSDRLTQKMGFKKSGVPHFYFDVSEAGQ